MATEIGSWLNPVIRSFIEQKQFGIFLYDLLPWSDLIVYHRIKVADELTNGIVLVGDQSDLQIISKIISEKLIAKQKDDGFWSGLFLQEQKLLLGYQFNFQLSSREIIELLSLKFRNELIFNCRLMLSPLSFIQIKFDGSFIENIPLALTEEQRQAEVLPLEQFSGIKFQ